MQPLKDGDMIHCYQTGRASFAVSEELYKAIADHTDTSTLNNSIGSLDGVTLTVSPFLPYEYKEKKDTGVANVKISAIKRPQQ